MAESGNEFAITVPTLFDGERFLSDHCVVVDGETVTRISPATDCPAGLATLSLTSGILAPGFIDLQVNGGGDFMLNNAPGKDTVNAMYAAHRATGTTAMLPTVLSDRPEVQRKAVDAVCAARTGGNPGILGVHIEGPFFDPGKRGAHRDQYIRAPQDRDIDWLCAVQDLIVMVTLAPEHVPPEYIERLARHDVLICAGHTNASYEQVQAAAKLGLQGITHLFNAMSPATSRQPGTVGAALDNDALWVGIIADGHHVHPAGIRLAHKAKPSGKLVLVTDAMATVGGNKHTFELYGEAIVAQNGRLVNADGALAGSAIGMIDAVRYANRSAGLPLAECLRMASLYPAAILQLDDSLGRIASGLRADLVHFDEGFRVRNTWLAGQQQSHNEGDSF